MYLLVFTASQPGVDVTVTCGPRSVQTAKRCPALPILKPGEVDKVEDVPDRGYNTPCNTLNCLSIGTSKTINFPFVPNGKLMVLDVPIF